MMITIKKILKLLSFCIIVVLVGCGGAQDQEAKYLARAQAHFDENNLKKARVEIKNVLQINPKNVEGRYLLAEIEEKNQNWKEMYANLMIVVKEQPEHAEAQIKLGKFLLLSNQADKAMEKADLILAQSNNHIGAMALKGAVLLRKGDNKTVQEIGENILSIEPGNVEATTLLVKVLVDEKQSDKAIELINKALLEHPEEVNLSIIKINLLTAGEDYDEAEKVFLSLREQFPDRNFIHYNLAKFYLVQKKPEKAEEVLKSLIEKQPDEIEPKMALVKFWIAQKNQQKAEEILLQFIKDEPEVYEFRFALLDLYKDNPQRMREMLKDIIAADGEGIYGLRARNDLAVLAIREGDQDYARQLITEVIDNDQQNETALLLRAALTIEDGKYDDAIADLRTVLRGNPNSEKALLLLTSAYIKNGLPDLAQESLEKVININPKNLPARKDLVRMLVKNKDEAAAILLLEQSRIMFKEDVDVASMLVDLYIRRKEWVTAEKTAEAIAQIPESSEIAHYKLGQIFLAQEKYQKAVNEFREVLEIRPNAENAIALLVKSYQGLGEINQAEVLLDGLITENPDSIFLLSLRGNIHVNQSQFNEAEVIYNRIIELEPNLELGYQKLATLYLIQNAPEKAKLVYKQGQQAVPNSIGLMFGEVALYEQAGDESAAVDIYKKILAIEPGNIVAANNLAVLFGNKKDPQSLQQGLELAQQFKNIENPVFQDTYGWLLYLNGDIDDAIVVLEGAITKESRVPDFHYHLGMAYAKKGRTEEAKQELQTAVSANDVDFNGIEEAKAKLEELQKL